MKPFINNLLIGMSVGLMLAACSSKEEPQDQLPVIAETEIVQDPVLPATAQAVSAPVVTQEEKPVPSTSANQGILNVKAWDQKLKFLTTHFEQVSQYDGVQISKSHGALYYDKAKNLLRLDTLNDEDKPEQTAITDKQQILILDGEGREVTTLSWAEWQQGQPNQALFDFGNYTALLARHHVIEKEPYVLELTPKNGGNYTLYLTLSREDYFPTHIKIISDLMQTEATLANTQKNQPLAFDTFRLGGLFK